MNKIPPYLLICFMILIGCTQHPTTPSKAFIITKKAILRSNWQIYWNMLSKQSKQRFDHQVEYMQKTYPELSDQQKRNLLKSMNIAEQDFFKLDGKLFFINALNVRNSEENKDKSYKIDLFKSCEIINIEQNKRSAIVYIEDDEGNEEKIPLIKEDDEWKLDFGRFYPF